MPGGELMGMDMRVKHSVSSQNSANAQAHRLFTVGALLFHNQYAKHSTAIIHIIECFNHNTK
jgi:hypothetical protein